MDEHVVDPDIFKVEKEEVERAIVSVEVMVDADKSLARVVGVAERRILGLSEEAGLGFILIEGVGSDGGSEKYSKFLGDEKLVERQYAVFGSTTEDVDAKRKELHPTGFDHNKMRYLFIKPAEESGGAVRLVVSVPGENRGELAELVKMFKEAVENRSEGEHESFKEYR